MVNNELSGFGVVLKCQFLSNEPQFEIWLVTTSHVSIGVIRCCSGMENTYALHIMASAASRSLFTNISMRYAPMLGVSRYSWKNL